MPTLWPSALGSPVSVQIVGEYLMMAPDTRIWLLILPARLDLPEDPLVQYLGLVTNSELAN